MVNDENSMVNDENFGEMLIEGLKEVAAHRRGELPWLNTSRRFVPPRSGDDPGPDAPQREPGPRNRIKW